MNIRKLNQNEISIISGGSFCFGFANLLAIPGAAIGAGVGLILVAPDISDLYLTAIGCFDRCEKTMLGNDLKWVESQCIRTKIIAPIAALSAFGCGVGIAVGMIIDSYLSSD